MIKLFHHQWLEFIRSINWQKSVFLNVLSVVIGTYIMLNAVIVGYYADVVIQSVYGESNVIWHFSELLLFYLLFDFFTRFMMQKSPVLTIQPYLILPISKKKLIHYHLLKSFFSFFNVLGLCLIFPFFIKVVVAYSDFSFASIWLLSVLALIFTNNFLVFIIKKKYSSNPKFIFLFIIFLGMALYVDFEEIYNLSNHFSAALLFLSGKIYWIFVPLGILFASYYLAYRFLKNQLRLEDDGKQILKRFDSASFLGNYGQTMGLLAVELKMIFRNKRPKTALFFGLLMIPYGFILYQHNLDDFLLQLFIGLMIISGTAMPYGQFVFSWQSSHFDGLLANKINVLSYVKSKYLVIAIMAIMSYILSIPFVYNNPKILLTHTAILLYTIGISSMLVLFCGCFKTKPINLGRNQMMNYEGVSVVDFLVLLPVIGIPAVLYFGFFAFDKAEFFIFGLGFIGVIGIVFNRFMLRLIVRLLKKHKYNMSVGFRSI